MFNKASTSGCDCKCCEASCPYNTVLVFINSLVSKGVSNDIAAQIAVDFVRDLCNQNKVSGERR